MFLAACAVSGCAGLPHEVRAPACCGCERGVVFTADGAGGFGTTSSALRSAIAEEGLPLCVATVPWSHGFGRGLADQVDYGHARAEGACLAGEVLARRQSCPGGAIFLVGHSAGCAVVLAAAEALPPGSVDGIVLLAPSVSADYDLRPALCCARRGIDVFTSERDLLFLGLGTSLVGTADRRWSAAAGRVGFRPVAVTPEDFALYAKLRQHPWHSCVAWTGNPGTHYGCHFPRYLRAYVLPLLCPVEPSSLAPNAPPAGHAPESLFRKPLAA
jgi:pimeloyl-ACP methyl ester carboxylesterase